MTKNYLIFTEQPWVIGDLRKTLINHVLQVVNMNMMKMMIMKKKGILMRILIQQSKSLGQIMYRDSEVPLRFHDIDDDTLKQFSKLIKKTGQVFGPNYVLGQGAASSIPCH